jgi:hypothetical protein
MEAPKLLAYMLDPSLILAAQGIQADPWQRDLLMSQEREIILNCSRQAGKSTTVAALCLHTALFQPKSLVLVLSPTQRQSHELFRKILDAYNALGRPVATSQDAQTLSKLELENGSRIIGLPGKEANIRSFSGVRLLVLDEASRIADDLYRSVRPMLAVSQGRLVLLSTPFGQRGFFWEEWTSKKRWKRVKITWKDCPRITPEFIANERKSMGDMWVEQEYECSFTSLEGLVYPDFERCVIHTWPDGLPGKLVGGIDFGWRNPFAAVWGCLDRDDVLWIGWERYLRETPLHLHVEALKKAQPRDRQIQWYADPAGRTEIEEMRAANLLVRKGDNDVRMGIAAVTARLKTGRLKVHSRCVNLLEESRLYRYPTRGEVLSQKLENPLDQDNHALGALRYLVSRLDVRFIGKLRKRASSEGVIELETIEGILNDGVDKEVEEAVKVDRPSNPWLDWGNEALWEKL